MKTDYAGIDYSMGKSNRDQETGIHYGVINQNEVLQAWADSSESFYGKPHCPKCGNAAVEFDDDKHDDYEYEKYECADYACENCEKVFGNESALPDEALSYFIDDGEYSAECSDDMGDIFITRSPYYTWAQYCSPCAPGAGYLMNWTDKEVGIKAYCFGHDWFDIELKHAPYPVYRVEDDSAVESD